MFITDRQIHKCSTKRLNVNKKSAMTLAEALITLGIIGVVAAYTIPVLMNNIQDQQFKQMWKKEYSVISQAYERVKDDEGGDLSGYFIPEDHNAPAQIITKMGQYLLYIKSCNIPYISDYSYVCGTGGGVPTVDLYKLYKTLSGGYVYNYNLISGQYILKDGTNLYFRSYNDRGSLIIYIDVNGYIKKPNTLGKDLFGMIMTKDKIMPFGAIGTGLQNTCNTTAIACPGNTDNWGGDCAGAGCSMDYLSQ